MKSENLVNEYVDTDSVYNKKLELSSLYGICVNNKKEEYIERYKKLNNEYFNASETLLKEKIEGALEELEYILKDLFKVSDDEIMKIVEEIK